MHYSALKKKEQIQTEGLSERGKKRRNCRVRTSYGRAAFPYRLNRDDIPAFFKSVILALIICKLFYDSFLIMPLMIPLMWFYIKKERKSRNRKRCREVGLQFRDAILSACAGMKAGSSVENAFVEASRDMALLHGTGSMICEELRILAKGLANSLTLEELLMRMADRTDNDDIREFAEVFRIAKRSGGNMTQVITDTAKVISDRIEVEHQIMVITSAKRLEARLMEVVPLFIILYIGITTPGFFAPLYHNAFGYVFMTVALGIYAFAYMTAERIIEIEV